MNSEPNASSSTGSAGQEITPEVARQVADRVYALWLKDVRLENERRRLRSRKWLRRGKK